MNKQVEQMEQSSSNSNRWVIIALAVIFILPVLSAYIAFYGFNLGAVGGGNHHGQLLSPPALIDQFNLTQSGEQINFANMKRKWWLVYVNDEENCLDSCSDAIHLMKQLHIALGKNAERLSRLLIQKESSQVKDTLQDGLTVVYTGFTEAGIQAIAKPNPELNQQLKKNKFYLIDPRGFVILEYDLNARETAGEKYGKEQYFKGVLKDIKKLMKFSRIG